MLIDVMESSNLTDVINEECFVLLDTAVMSMNMAGVKTL